MYTEEQVAQLLKTLHAPVTDVDCGTLCAPANSGVPVCCDKAAIVPVLYKTEYELLRKRSKLWKPYQAKTAHQKELKQDTRGCDKVCECRGAAHCERDNRSVVCRTFPFEPYLDHDDELVGLVYNFDFKGLCPLVASRHAIRPDYIDQAISMWELAFSWSEEEVDFYHDHSETLRRSFGQLRKKIPVLTRRGMVRMRTSR
jgi:hypothetical protein